MTGTTKAASAPSFKGSATAAPNNSSTAPAAAPTRFCDKVGRELGYDVVPVYADWHRLGSAAGPVRNRRMIDEYRPRLVVAFHDDLEASRGTANCVTQALSRGVPVLWWTQEKVTTLV